MERQDRRKQDRRKQTKDEIQAAVKLALEKPDNIRMSEAHEKLKFCLEINKRLQIIGVSDLFCKITGYSRKELWHRDLCDLLPQGREDNFLKNIEERKKITRYNRFKIEDISLKYNNGETGMFDANCCWTRDGYLIIYFADVRKAFYDELTGIFNRRGFRLKAEMIMGIFERIKEIENIYLFYFDIDNFKILNDTLGHDSGDRILKNFAHILQNEIIQHRRLRKSDIIGRWGGDEFLILMAGELASIKHLLIIPPEILVKHTIPGWDLSVSIGLAKWNKSMPLDELIKEAESNMYKEKARKKRDQTADGIKRDLELIESST